MADFKKIHPLRAGLTACFFLFSFSCGFGADNIWTFDTELLKAHNLILNLQTDQAHALLTRPGFKANEFHKLYLTSLSETVEMLITEDEKKFELVEVNFKKRLSYLDGLPDGPEKIFLEAELNLQLGFNYLNLGQELNAVLAIRKAYNITQDCLEKYPNFIPIKKTSGVIQVMVGAVPDKYHWFMSLLGMKGSVVTGQKQLEELKTSKSSLSSEATILFYTIKGFINQEFGEAAYGFEEYLKVQPGNRLVLFLGVTMLVKNGQAEEALKLVHGLDAHPEGLPMHYIDYQRGEILLCKGDYAGAIQAYLRFIHNFKSQSLKKDAYYKIGLSFILLNKKELGLKNFEIARKTGRETSDPDKYAAHQLEVNGIPNVKILRARFATDGGYYKEAREALQSIQPSELTAPKDQVEFYYRKARLTHRTGDINAARIFYQQTIDMTGDHNWYFAPNAALQMGYIAVAQNNKPLARKYFEKALSYRKHEYKNSIDTKAKAALDQLKN